MSSPGEERNAIVSEIDALEKSGQPVPMSLFAALWRALKIDVETRQEHHVPLAELCLCTCCCMESYPLEGVVSGMGEQRRRECPCREHWLDLREASVPQIVQLLEDSDHDVFAAELLMAWERASLLLTAGAQCSTE